MRKREVDLRLRLHPPGVERSSQGQPDSHLAFYVGSQILQVFPCRSSRFLGCSGEIFCGRGEFGGGGGEWRRGEGGGGWWIGLENTVETEEIGIGRRDYAGLVGDLSPTPVFS
ncbi:hypothetical protein LIER_21739 [Lithospermum erythrorhizon]|uniref:Uncharacterized protein n=1 Tax=Lithospermum erythrorhizon TaxID=34254 RepID=A0AAV3QTR1_LITER